jgi:hypothetical protein
MLVADTKARQSLVLDSCRSRPFSPTRHILSSPGRADFYSSRHRLPVPDDAHHNWIGGDAPAGSTTTPPDTRRVVL